MHDFLRALTKAELHLHLEGSIRPATLREIAPALTQEEIDQRYRYRDFAGFLKSYGWVTGHLAAPADYALIARRLLEELAGENVHYAELNISAGVMLWRNQEIQANFDSIDAAVRAQPIPVRYIFDAVRQFGTEHVRHVAEWAVRLRDRGVVGFGIGGDEARGPVESFRDTFAFARERGLHLAPHAGETCGPESIWRALECGAERIGHGIRAVDDPVLVRHLADRRIPLEICLSSNVRTGVAPRLADHPLRRLFDAGVPVVLSTDDPAMFQTTLTEEFEIAAREFGFTREELRGLAENGFRYAFSGAADPR